MLRIETLDADFKSKFLDYLYKEELYYTNLIETLENFEDQLGMLYVDFHDGPITAFIHFKDDGNSLYTTFNYTHKHQLNKLKDIILTVNSSNSGSPILLGGRLSQVKSLLACLGDHRECSLNHLFTLDSLLFKEKHPSGRCSIEKLSSGTEHYNEITDMTIGFMEPDTQEALERLTSKDITESKISRGLYILKIRDTVIGMARFFGNTKNYSEITSVYIKPEYRGQGFGTDLMILMIQESLKLGRIPVLETAENNKEAMKLYESLGFQKRNLYAFEFLQK